ncbi:amidohydrolase family protein [Arenimonas donghaensis]|uniref:Amidohydrolase-related domain-containing protein n=1 Tax=Arenimonas donghaensis DSM 18148 = HO3-R19 TaxID=1121014 RepID=A0A087MJW3_9GAMM|nr:amidohydrolase family protein [Arenimonas donghaensis]KFL37166.1 hypothetical protein N788_10795 [Arenimonas donghaensis DSM 18148 = HO3-R19]
MPAPRFALPVALATWLGAGLAALASLAAPPTSGTAYENGRWFDGEQFVAATWYVVDGRLTRQQPDRLSGRVDLAGGHVVPPFAEAHNHNLQNAWGVTRMRQAYVDQGVMYAAMLCGDPLSTTAAREALGPSPGVDVLFASACISSADGHPLRMARQQPDGSLAPVQDIHDKSYIVMDTVADIERKWPLVQAAAPDLVKAILVHSERPEHRTDPAMHGINGLEPALLAPLVERAHGAGLRVAVHTESAADFDVAVQAGVDWISHLPGYRFWKDRDESDYRLDDASIRLAAERGIVVIATANQAVDAARGDAGALARVQALQRENLGRLMEAGVQIAIGSDAFGGTSLVEHAYLRDLQVMDDAALLRALVETTPQLLYPQRKIGRFEEGYEASFLVLDGDPLRDPTALSRIRVRVRAGEPMPAQP